MVVVGTNDFTTLIIDCNEGALPALKEETFELQLAMENEESENNATLNYIRENSFKGILRYSFGEIFEEVLQRHLIEFLKLVDGRIEDCKEIDVKDIN